MTTGAAWKSEEAGPNRILRWVMLESDNRLKDFDIDMSKLKPQVVAKLREKSANYDSCIRVAMSLAFSTCQMPDAPVVKRQLVWPSERQLEGPSCGGASIGRFGSERQLDWPSVGGCFEGFSSVN